MNKKSKLKPYWEYGVGNTPLYHSKHYSPSPNFYIKLEQFNTKNNIKTRTAYFIIKDLIEKNRIKKNTKLVESSSGNLGIGLGYFSNQIGAQFLCLVDPTVSPEKLKELESHGIEYRIVNLGNYPDYRTARIKFAQELDKQPDWIWTNQYDNPANYLAHFETTGPEICSQLNYEVDWFICSVGTGGTICGTGNYLKKKIPDVKIVAVEPLGSTIFGGEKSKYLTAGSGMPYPSIITKKYGQVIDYFCKVDDRVAINECLRFQQMENISVGITTGSVLSAARHLAAKYPDQKIVCISPDSGKYYIEIFDQYELNPEYNPEAKIEKLNFNML